ncbi:MAG: hypothetical protein AAGI53_15135 [Planctomycetota bacterium]
MTIGRSCALCCAHAVLFAGPVLGQPAWDLGESRVRVFADASLSGDDACVGFDDALLLEFPGKPFVSQASSVGDGQVFSFANVRAGFAGSALTSDSVVTVHADAGQACTAWVNASSRVEAVVEASPSRAVCFDVRFSADVTLDAASVASDVWVRVVADGSNDLVVTTALVPTDGRVSGRLAGLASGSVLIDTQVPRHGGSGEIIEAAIESKSVVRLFTADLVAPFGIIDSADVSAFVDGYLGADCAFDYDGSGWVDLGDIDIFLRLFAGEPCPTFASAWVSPTSTGPVGAPCSP